jgi:hypothetical protein
VHDHRHVLHLCPRHLRRSSLPHLVSWSAHRAALSMYEIYGSERAPTTCCRFWAGRFRTTNILGFARTRCGYRRNAPQRATRADNCHS